MSYYGFVAYQDFVLNSYFWLMLGILFRLSEFPRNLPVTQTNCVKTISKRRSACKIVVVSPFPGSSPWKLSSASSRQIGYERLSSAIWAGEHHLFFPARLKKRRWSRQDDPKKYSERVHPMHRVFDIPGPHVPQILVVVFCESRSKDASVKAFFEDRALLIYSPGIKLSGCRRHYRPYCFPTNLYACPP